MSTLRWLGFAVMAAFAAFVGVMLLGYTIADIGGWEAAGLVVAVLVPLVLLSALAYLRPSVAVPALAVAACAPIGFGVMKMLDYGRWNQWEDDHGPISLVLVVVVGAACAVLGLSRPTAAGILLLAVAVTPLLLEVLGAGSEWARALSIGLVLFPVVVSGILFLVAGRQAPGPEALSRPGRLAH